MDSILTQTPSSFGFSGDNMTDDPHKPADVVSELRLLSPVEVQEVFNRSDRTIRRWVKQGLLVPVRMGRSLFFRREDITRIIVDELRKHGSG